MIVLVILKIQILTLSWYEYLTKEIEEPSIPHTNDNSTKEIDTKIQIIDSYDIKTNLFKMDYIKKLIKLQRIIKEFIYKKKIKKISTTTFSKKSLASKTHSNFSDVQSIMSMKSNKISSSIIN